MRLRKVGWLVMFRKRTHGKCRHVILLKWTLTHFRRSVRNAVRSFLFFHSCRSFGARNSAAHTYDEIYEAYHWICRKINRET